ncbi:DnaA/Hda family protein [Solidesulfovibrio carbinolicus]|uniref:Chromosomal replication initiator protein DnaA n=1 Tax=Solidesulfovibrio carbinolicus TaxID=296842 RepID=A0A4P6HIW0_9BACT|nr:DnaA/Hda family protein [Solidesulfovibrio carbinolicus]QAZ65710.1 chromosomal replication initiator DnaA [Solidesulfovibrio carbinolicus]
MTKAPATASGDGVLKNDFRQHLSRTCPEQDLRRWFDPLEIIPGEGEPSCCVVFPHAYFAAWFDGSVKELFERQLAAYLGPGHTVRYRTRGMRAATPAFAADAAVVTDFPYGHRFTFETFFSNEKNAFPLALAREVSRGGEVRYNPFLVCGPSGAGKTHLLRAMANAVAKSQPTSRIYFGSVADIQALYADARRPRPEIRAELSSHDWLFIDELTDVARAPDLEPELIGMFNDFHDAGRQMVFSSRERAASCDFLDPTFRSRLEWGLMVHLKAPDLSIRARFVEQVSKDKRLGLSREQVLTLAGRFEGFRRLEGVLLRLEAFRQHAGGELSDAEFSRHIRLSEDKKAPELSPERVIAVCAEHFGIPARDIVGAGRKKELVFARQAAMTLCRSLLGLSYPALGKVFGGKDHSTVLYSIRKFQQILDVDQETKMLLRQLSKKCRQGGQA